MHGVDGQRAGHERRGVQDVQELSVRSPRFEVLRCLHFVDVTRVCLTMPWVVSLLISRLRVGSGAWTVRTTGPLAWRRF